MRSKLLSGVAATMLGLLLGALPAVAAAEVGVEAVLAPRHVEFVYQGFSTHFSCGGLRGEIEAMLEKLGARELKVLSYGCVRGGGVEPFPGVRVRMQVLVPATQPGGTHAGPVVHAHWQRVVLLSRTSSLQDQGNCELIEQFKETFLPLFTTRNISYQSNCVPHQVTFGTHLSAEVLMPDAKAHNAR